MPGPTRATQFQVVQFPSGQVCLMILDPTGVLWNTTVTLTRREDAVLVGLNDWQKVISS